jgi:hypothetical protein
MRVTLSWEEMEMGVALGSRIVISSLQQGRPLMYGQPDFDWTNNIEGTLAEMAVAKALGLPFTPKRPQHQDPDLGSDIQVRWTPKSANSLIVRQSDPRGHRFILVTGKAPSLTLRGWMVGAEATQPQYWRELDNGRPPAWFVPQSALRPMEDWS